MARVNGTKREAKRLNQHIETFKGFRAKYAELTASAQESNENRIKMLEKRLAEI